MVAGLPSHDWIATGVSVRCRIHSRPVWVFCFWSVVAGMAGCSQPWSMPSFQDGRDLFVAESPFAAESAPFVTPLSVFLARARISSTAWSNASSNSRFPLGIGHSETHVLMFSSFHYRSMDGMATATRTTTKTTATIPPPM